MGSTATAGQQSSAHLAEKRVALLLGEHPGDNARRRVDSHEVVGVLERQFARLAEAGRRVVDFSASTVKVGGDYSPYDWAKLWGRMPIRNVTRFALQHAAADSEVGPPLDDVRVDMVLGAHRSDAVRYARDAARAEAELLTTRANIEQSGRQIIGECEGISYVGWDYAQSDWAGLRPTRLQQVAAHYIVHAAGVAPEAAPAVV